MQIKWMQKEFVKTLKQKMWVNIMICLLKEGHISPLISFSTINNIQLKIQILCQCFLKQIAKVIQELKELSQGLIDIFKHIF